MSNLSRRSLVTSAAALPAFAVPAVAAIGPDPIFAALERVKPANEVCYRLCNELDEAEGAASEVHGHRPIPLVTFRHWHTGGQEMLDYKNQLIEQGEPKEIVEAEYRKAKEREERLQRSEKEWDIKTGLATLRAKSEAAWGARDDAYYQLVEIGPSTPAGAAALLELVIEDMEGGDREWQGDALAAVVRALKSMSSMSAASQLARAK